MDDSRVKDFVVSFSQDCSFDGENVPIAKELVHKNDPSQVVISKINDITKHGEITGKDNCIYYCRVLPNLKCPVCFDHPQDHIPMMTLYESARQLGIALSHQYRNINMSGFRNIINMISFDSIFFSELDCALYLFCFDQMIKGKKNVQSRELNYYFMQNGLMTVKGVGSLTIMEKTIYHRLREKSRFKIFKDKEKLFPMPISNNIARK